MLAVVPFGALVHDTTVLLNPTFKYASGLVGGADADLVTGNMLVDFKTTKKGEVEADDLDQLLGYYLLARKHRQADPTFPAIERLGLYYCRHGHLWAVDAAVWSEHPQFSEIEAWFFDHARQLFDPTTAGAEPGG
jgi:hypothetical protein